MELRELSRWFWDIAKYVATAIIISSFLGDFRGNKTLLYVMSFAVIAVLMFVGTYLYKRSKRK